MRALLITLAVACGPPKAPMPPPPAFELVESTPSETSLDSALPDAAIVWLEMVASARRSIDLAELYLSNAPNSRLEPVVTALEAAIARGVVVRILVEKSFVKVYPDTIARLVKAGAKVLHADFAPGILHAKFFIVDDREAFVGSQNFDWRALEHILELGVRIREPRLVEGLATLFAHDWAIASGESLPPRSIASPSTSRLSLVASPRDRLPAGIPWELPPLVMRIDGAQTRVRVQLLTYRAGEWTELEVALVRAAKRGVSVELLLADWTKRDKTLPGLQALARTPNLEIRLASIPQAKRGFIPFARVIHAKLLVVDGNRGWFGTSNWERDYFYGSRNVGLLVDDASIAAELEQFFERAWTSPYAARLDPDGQHEAPRIE